MFSPTLSTWCKITDIKALSAGFSLLTGLAAGAESRDVTSTLLTVLVQSSKQTAESNDVITAWSRDLRCPRGKTVVCAE